MIAGEDVHVAGLHHEHEISGGRGEPDADNSLTQGRVDLRGASEVVELREYFADKMSEQANAEGCVSLDRRLGRRSRNGRVRRGVRRHRLYP